VGTALCIAVDNQGNMLTSSTVTAPTPAWRFSNVDETNLIASISCPALELCVAVDSLGNTLISTDPAAQVPTWTIALRDQLAGFASVSCPSTTLCAAGDTKGNVAISTDPSTGSPTWKLTNVDGVSTRRFGSKSLTIGCAQGGGLCAAGDFAGRVVVTTDVTAPKPRWKLQVIDGKGSKARAITGMSCPTTSTCVAVDDAGNVLVGRR
jgi:hypothetical protein